MGDGLEEDRRRHGKGEQSLLMGGHYWIQREPKDALSDVQKGSLVDFGDWNGCTMNALVPFDYQISPLDY